MNIMKNNAKIIVQWSAKHSDRVKCDIINPNNQKYALYVRNSIVTWGGWGRVELITGT